jgi:hypothetical protein
MEHRWNEIDRKKTEVLGGKTCPSATSSITNPTGTGLGSNPVLRGDRPATNRLSHGTAYTLFYKCVVSAVLGDTIFASSNLAGTDIKFAERGQEGVGRIGVIDVTAV